MLKNHFIKYTLMLLVIILTVFMISPRFAFAAYLTTLSDVMTRQSESTVSSHKITFTLGGSTTLDAGETAVIDFHEDDSGFTVAGATTVAADLDLAIAGADKTIVDIDGACTGHSGTSDMVAQVNDTTGVLTITACGSFTSSAAGAIISVEYGTAATTGGTGVNRVTNPATHGTYTIDITAAGDTGKLADAVIDNDSFTVTASVDPSLTMQMSATSSAFGALSTSSVLASSPNITLTVDTNAASGYSITIKDTGSSTNPGLYNSTATSIIGSGDYSYNNSADLSSVAGYGAQCSSASATCQSPYNVSGDNVGGYELTAQNFASYTGPATSHSITITNKAKITGATAAGNYTDTVTVIATGNF